MVLEIKDFTIPDLKKKNVLYYINKNNIGNTLIQFSIYNDKILKFSNEWLYLISEYFNSKKLNRVYEEILSNLLMVKIKKIDKKINKKVIPFITSFSTGTVHGYSGIFYILLEYINNYDKYKEYDIIVYENSQKGILDLINNAIEKNYIDRNKVIFLSSNTIYFFSEIFIIPNGHHNIYQPNIDFSLKINDYISKNIIGSINTENYGDKICLLKTSFFDNKTDSGILNHSEAVELAKRNGFTFLDLNKINDETKLINIIHKCSEFYTSWGTAFMKNFVYVSDRCQKIIVLIVGDDFKNQYLCHKNNNVLLLKFKNAIIEYKFYSDFNN